MKKEELNSYENYFQKALKDEVCVYNGEELKNGKAKGFAGEPFPEHIKKLGEFFGRKVKCYQKDEIFTLIGVSSTCEDYYYILKDENGEIFFESCVGKIELI